MVLRLLPMFFLILLLLFPHLSVCGAGDGLLLWFQIVLPSLTPFLIGTKLVAALDGIRLITRPFYPILHRIFGFSQNGCYIFLCGLLCGYPLGAGLCADMEKNNKISRQEASYLLSVCNHPGPMFLLGYVRSQMNPPAAIPLLLLCMYLPILPISMISRNVYKTKNLPLLSEPVVQTAAYSRQESLNSILLSAAETMVIIGGYIMLFSIFSTWVGAVTVFPPVIQALISGFLEITTGVHRICQVFSEKWQLIPVMICVSFGGLSGIFQTKSVIDSDETDFDNAKKAGLSIRHYAVWKALHALLSGLFAFLFTA